MLAGQPAARNHPDIFFDVNSLSSGYLELSVDLLAPSRR
jgi:hypothetical protein